MSNLKKIINSLECLVKDIYNDLSRAEILSWIKYDLQKLRDIDEDRCRHGMFYSGAGACPQCGQ